MIKSFASIAVVALVLCSALAAVADPAITMLHTSGVHIVDATGRRVRLQGYNLGGWMLIEPWMTPVRAGHDFNNYKIIQLLDQRFGVETEQRLLRTYEENWITTQDLDNIRAQGLNFIRVPIWWLNFETLDGTWRPDGFDMLDWVVREASKRGIYTLIDMHGVVGGEAPVQSSGQADNAYWTNGHDQHETAALWAKIATHYAGNPGVMGYDLINEPFGAPSIDDVHKAYASLYKVIRAVDPDHIIVMDSTYGSFSWDTMPNPATYRWGNIVYEVHEYVFGGDAPAVIKGAQGKVDSINAHREWDVPAYVGEFNNFGSGIDTSAGTDTWWRVMSMYNDDGFNWTCWAYKSARAPAPDTWGLYDPKTPEPPKPDLAHDDAATIEADWKQWTTANAFTINPMTAPIMRGGESPYRGVPQNIPGVIAADTYDNGGPGFGYDAGGSYANQGKTYRYDGVGIQPSTDASGIGDGRDVGWNSAGDWLRYTVDVAKAGDYEVRFRIASGGHGGYLHLEDVDGHARTDTIVVPSTGGWQTWADVTSRVHLAEGIQVIELYVDAGGFNIEDLKFTSL